MCMYIYIYMEVSIGGGTTIAGLFIMENPIQMDLGVPQFEETPI